MFWSMSFGSVVKYTSIFLPLYFLCAFIALGLTGAFLSHKPLDILSFVICVYTYDSNDKKDVKRIRKELKAFGIKEVIRYKTNKSTLEGKYANKGFKNISKYIG